MTVSSAIASATLNWTGAETKFTPGFQASAPGDVSVTWIGAGLTNGTLTLNTQFSVTLDDYGFVTVNVLAFPPAPAKITIARNSTPTQASAFEDGVPWSATVIEDALDLCALRDQELRRDISALGGTLTNLTGIGAQVANSVSVALTAWFLALPTSPPYAPGWWNDGGVPVYATIGTAGGPMPAPSTMLSVMTAWLLSLPTAPSATSSWWNNGGVPCFS